MGQLSLELDTLYELDLSESLTRKQLVPNIEVNGACTIYGSNSTTKPASLAAMSKDSSNEDFTGIMPFGVLPRWIAITGEATEITITGVRAVSRGAIS